MITCKFENGNEALLRHVVVHALMIKDNKMLLARRAPELLEGGKWGLAGGYMDRDETLEQAVRREVQEETGWQVADVQLISVIDNPNRPNENARQNIAFNYVCEAVKKTGESDGEVTEQKWFDLKKLPKKDEVAFDHYQIIQSYLQDKKVTKEVTIISRW
jgi:8-oxo-dGTP diphosphatase